LSPPDLDAYFAGCRARVPAFTRRHFGPLGTLRLHREAIGVDLEPVMDQALVHHL